MRIFVVHWGQSGGGTRFHLDLSSALIGNGLAAVSYNIDSDQAAAMAELSVGSKFRLRTYGNRLGVIVGIPRLIANAVRLAWYLRRQRFTHVVSSMESVYQSLIVPLLVPRSMTYVAVIHDAVQHPGDEHLLKRLGRCLELRRADKIITLSTAVADKLADRGVNRRSLTVLFHPAYTAGGVARPRSLPTNRPVIIGCFGRLVYYKGIDIFVESIDLARAAGLNVVGRVVGNGPEGRLSANAAPGIEWNIGWVPEDEVDKEFQEFDIVALTYREASQSGVIAHAWAHGVPIVVTPVGGLTEQVGGGRTGVIARTVDPQSIAEAIGGLLGDERRYGQLSRAGLAAARERSWPCFVAALNDALNSEVVQ